MTRGSWILIAVLTLGGVSACSGQPGAGTAAEPTTNPARVAAPVATGASPKTPTPRPVSPSAARPPTSASPAPIIRPSESCAIKGNISIATGEKIYHVPGQRDYDKTVITESKGERWFCTEADAVSAGWRKSKV